MSKVLKLLTVSFFSITVSYGMKGEEGTCQDAAQTRAAITQYLDAQRERETLDDKIGKIGSSKDYEVSAPTDHPCPMDKSTSLTATQAQDLTEAIKDERLDIGSKPEIHKKEK